MLTTRGRRARRVASAAPAVAALVFSALVFSALVFSTAGAAARQGPDPLAKGNLYYSSDDISGKAAEEYRKVKNNLRYKGTKTGGAAQFLYASYYHRKFYIVRYKFNRDDEDAINKAQKEYEDYIKDYRRASPPEYLSDSYFNLALIWLEYGHPGQALAQLDSLLKSAGSDPTVFVYDVIWSPRSGDRVEGYYDAAQLAGFTAGLIRQGRSTQDVVQAVRQWCREHRQG